MSLWDSVLVLVYVYVNIIKLECGLSDVVILFNPHLL